MSEPSRTEALKNEAVASTSTRPLGFPDDQVEHPDEGGGAPRTVEQIKAEIADQHRRVIADLADARKHRARINAVIKALVAEEADLRRVTNSFKPRKAKT